MELREHANAIRRFVVLAFRPISLLRPPTSANEMENVGAGSASRSVAAVPSQRQA